MAGMQPTKEQVVRWVCVFGIVHTTYRGHFRDKGAKGTTPPWFKNPSLVITPGQSFAQTPSL